MAKRPDLQRYREKRNFGVTPEPPPTTGPVQPGDRPTFMVHKHDATRLHYDLRLELDGALASWALPKGPSYDPAQKRLAVQTEDHPLEYGNFEGRIPDGEYGAGDSIIWDRGTYDTVPPGQASAQRKKGHLEVELAGEKLRGRWHLIRTQGQGGGKEQWLCFKAKDGKERAGFDVVALRPESVLSGRRVTRGPERAKVLRAVHPPADTLLDRIWPPMLAKLSSPEHAPAADYLYEVKYDGYRGLAGVSNGKVAFRTRNGIDLSGRFPQVARALSRLVVGSAVIDGEVVALDADGVSRFGLLMTPDAEHRFMAFDLLWLDGEDLRGRPLEERRELLQSVMANHPPPLEVAEEVHVPEVEEGMAVARSRRLEGLIAKKRGSTYVGARSPDWLKLKVNQAQELAIIGFTPIKTGARQIGALLLGIYDQGTLRFAGKVGTGYTQKLRGELYRQLTTDRLEATTAEDAPRLRDAIWVKPRLVAQVAFTEWTADGKLRHPSFQGLREDKRPEECVRESATPKKKKAPATRRGKKTAQRPRAAARTAGRGPSPEVKLTSSERVVFPDPGLTKGDVFHYYQQVAAPMVAALDGRPIAMQQFPQGTHRPGFYRQDAKGAPAWATVVRVPHEGKDLDKLIVDRPETLLWLANYSAFTIHMWSSRLPHLGEPDWVVFDLDPGEGSWEDLIKIATTLRGMLEHLNLASFPKTSGKRGLHLFVPMARGHTHEDAVEFAVAITSTLGKGLHSIATTERSKAKRGGRLYLDAFQNGRGKTVVAPYSVRALPGAPVSAPLRWSEVTTGLNPLDFTVQTMPRRLDKLGDLFAPVLKTSQRLPRFS